MCRGLRQLVQQAPRAVGPLRSVATQADQQAKEWPQPLRSRPAQRFSMLAEMYIAPALRPRDFQDCNLVRMVPIRQVAYCADCLLLGHQRLGFGQESDQVVNASCFSNGVSVFLQSTRDVLANRRPINRRDVTQISSSGSCQQCLARLGCPACSFCALNSGFPPRSQKPSYTMRLQHSWLRLPVHLLWPKSPSKRRSPHQHEFRLGVPCLRLPNCIAVQQAVQRWRFSAVPLLPSAAV